METFVRVHECASLADAELAKAALCQAGIAATIQGGHAGQLLGELAPARFPILVGSEHVAEARELLRTLELPDLPRAPTVERSVPRARIGSFARAVVGLHVFALAGIAGLALATIVVIAVADTVHPTPYGHMISGPIQYRYLVAAIALFLTFSKWAREKGWIAVVVLTFAIVACSVRPRSIERAPKERPESRPRSAPW